MDVLNTYGGGVDAAGVIIGIFVLCVAAFTLYAFLFALKERVYWAALLFVLFVVLQGCLAVIAFTSPEPIRHEVTLRPGGVIDAVKYDIIEQRGAIFVIEERTPAE
ncbi:hypothetical protein [Paenibacillus sp. B-A-8]|uniref:hypothetical protein n=1 Tax=Paenibacillus sp. B-A-8 TaxID=3400419 RepID=UPI003B02DC37